VRTPKIQVSGKNAPKKKVGSYIGTLCVAQANSDGHWALRRRGEKEERGKSSPDVRGKKKCRVTSWSVRGANPSSRG